MINELKIKLPKIKFSVFYLAYIAYFISLFLEDLALQFLPIIKLIRYGSYLLFFISVLVNSKTQKSYFYAIICLLFACGFAVVTRDIYYCALIIILLASYKSKPESTFKLSFHLMLILTIITVCLCIVGVFPNLNTGNRNFDDRYSLGFYHSNVLPMVVYYLLGYRFMIKGNSISNKELLCWFILSLGVNVICRGRNGLVGVILLLAGYYFYRYRAKFKILYYVSMFSTLIVSIALILLSVFQGKHNGVLYIINRFFTGRLALAYHQINSTGLHFINLMNKHNFSSFDTFVLDSGYLYVAIHYGLFFSAVYAVFQMISAKKYQNNAMALLVFAVNTLTNSIDNDLFSYNMLPFLTLLTADIDFNTLIKNIVSRLELNKQKGFRIIDK